MINVAYSLVTYHVTDLSSESCESCLTSLKTTLIQVPGIVGVDVNPAEAKISILTDGPADDRLIRAAVETTGAAVDA